MLKKKEIETPNSCWNKANDNTFVFVLLEWDAATPDTIREWVRKRIELGLNKPEDKKITDAILAIEYVEDCLKD